MECNQSTHRIFTRWPESIRADQRRRRWNSEITKPGNVYTTGAVLCHPHAALGNCGISRSFFPLTHQSVNERGMRFFKDGGDGVGNPLCLNGRSLLSIIGSRRFRESRNKRGDKGLSVTKGWEWGIYQEVSSLEITAEERRMERRGIFETLSDEWTARFKFPS